MFAQHPRFMCRGLTYSLVVFSLTLVTRAQAQELKPPRPNPNKPVDYIEWINRTWGSGIKENAADVYRRAASTTATLKGEWEPTLTQPWTDRPDVEKWLQAHRKQMELFKQAAAMEQCYFSLGAADAEKEKSDPRFEKALITVLLPEVSPMRHLAKGLLADGFRKWGGGDRKPLPQNVGLLLRTSRHLASGPSLMHRSVALATADSSYKSLRHALRYSDEPSKTAGELLVVLSKTDRPWPALQRVYEIERVAAWDYVQRVFVPVGALQRLLVPDGGGPHRIHANISQLSIKDTATLQKIGYQATLQEINDYYDQFHEWLSVPYPQATREVEELERILAASKNPLTPVFLSWLTSLREREERVQASRRGTYLVLYLFDHQRRTGSFPKSLGELKASDLAQLRIDPFSGKDFVYRPSGKDFVLYSVGANLKDDGGRQQKESSEGDYVYWPVTDEASPKPTGNQGSAGKK